MGVFSRSWNITKLSFRVVRKDKELFIYAILSSILSIIFMIAMLFPTIISQIMAGGSPTEWAWLEYVFIFLTYLGLSLITTFFNVCTVYTAKQRFAGKNATMGESFKFAFSKFHLILGWSLISATVGLLLNLLENLAQSLGQIGAAVVRVFRGILAFAWGIITIFVVPVMVYEDVGPIDAIKKSTKTLSKTWGETIIRRFGLGLIEFLVILAGLAINAGVGYLLYMYFDLTGIFIAIGIAAVYVLVVVLAFNIASKVYNTALYEYAETGKVPTGYDKPTMKNAFKMKA